MDVGSEHRIAVDALHAFDPAKRARLDQLTEVAARALDFPIATITVLDGDVVHFIGSTGLPADATYHPRDVFCHRTQQIDDLVEVVDATLDPTFADLPLVRDGGIRAYVGHPLRDSQGQVVATFCLLSDQPRQLSRRERDLFLQLASWARDELLSSSEMKLAAQAQSSLLPEHAIEADGWTIDGACLPASAVGGDFYDFVRVGDVVSFRLGDVMGKGTSAALLGAGVRAALRGTVEAVAGGVDLGVTVTRSASTLFPDLDRAKSFVTLFEGAVDLRTGQLRWVDAGCGFAIVVRCDGTWDDLGRTDPPIGILDDDFWTEHRDQLGPGDRLVVASDGLLDILGAQGWQKSLADIVHRTATVHEGLALLRTVVDESTSPLDDVTVLVVARAVVA